MPVVEPPPRSTPPSRCLIRVVIRKDADPDGPPVHDRTGDHSDATFREWITHTTWWAMRNAHTISMFPQA